MKRVVLALRMNPEISETLCSKKMQFFCLLLLFSRTTFSFRTCHYNQTGKANNLSLCRSIGTSQNEQHGVETSAKRREVSYTNNDKKPRIYRLIRRQKRKYKSKRSHHESHTNAAGAEQLFSSSLWSTSFSFSFKCFRNNGISFIREKVNARIEKKTVHHFPTMSNVLADLPSIDCDWACHNQEEQYQLRKMKFLLQEELHHIVRNNLDQRYPDVYSDLRLLRFLRKSSDRDPISASELYRSFLSWRVENSVDNIRAMVENKNNRRVPYFYPQDERLQAVATYFPCNFDYMTAHHNTLDRCSNKNDIAVLYIGSWDTCGITENILTDESDLSMEDFLSYWIYLYESIHCHLYHQSIDFGQMIYLDEVCDLTSMSLRQFSPKFVSNVMKPWLQMTQSNYPETTRRIYILNPPAIINLAWNLVTPLLSQGTVYKICFVRKFQGSADEFCRSSGIVCD